MPETKLEDELASLDSNQKKNVERCIVYILDTVLHDFLVALQESHDLGEGIEVFVDNKNVAELSGMLHGEIFGEGGWIEKYCKYPPCEDIPQ